MGSLSTPTNFKIPQYSTIQNRVDTCSYEVFNLFNSNKHHNISNYFLKSIK